MPNTIEIAKSGRATCRACRKNIAKGEKRFGVEMQSQFAEGGDTTYLWHHLSCAAGKHPTELAEALAAYEGEIEEREELERAIAEAEAKKPPPYPHADRAPTGRARCQGCGESIEKGALRVAVERDIERGTTVTKGAGYLHPACAAAYVESQGGTHDALTDAIRKNSRALSPDELDEVLAHV